MNRYKLLLILLAALIIFSCGKDDKKPEYSEDESKNTLKQNTEQEKKTDDVKNSGDENKKSSDETQQTQKELSGEKKNNSFQTEKPVAVITPLEAEDYNGKTVTVKGFVADIYQSEKVAYLNFVKKFPDNPFTAVIFARQFEDFPNINKYRGKDVEVTGKVSIYKGKPQIILNSPSQITVN